MTRIDCPCCGSHHDCEENILACCAWGRMRLELTHILNTNPGPRPYGTTEPFDFHPFQWSHIRHCIYYRDAGKCRGCGVDFPISWEVHHIVPRHLGGSDHPHNLVLLCRDCHVRTLGRDYDEWIMSHHLPYPGFGQSLIHIPRDDNQTALDEFVVAGVGS